jgi:hypothetical protein
LPTSFWLNHELFGTHLSEGAGTVRVVPMPNGTQQAATLFAGHEHDHDRGDDCGYDGEDDDGRHDGAGDDRAARR